MLSISLLVLQKKKKKSLFIWQNARCSLYLNRVYTKQRLLNIAKMRINNLLLYLVVVVPIIFDGCAETIGVETIMAPYVGGKFQFVNKHAKDTLIVGGDGHHKHNYKVQYLLEDSTEINCESNNYAYEAVLPRTSLRNHTIEFSAVSIEQIITSDAKVYLVVREKYV